MEEGKGRGGAQGDFSDVTARVASVEKFVFDFKRE
jgi:hypothetical protein